MNINRSKHRPLVGLIAVLMLNLRGKYSTFVRCALIVLLVAPWLSTAATLQVGINKPYQTITAAVTAAQPGSLIEIDVGIYADETININKDNLTLRGVGGRAHVRWGTGNYLTNTAIIGNGKAIFVISAPNATIENMEFSGAKVVDQNGAGIRYEGGNLIIRGSYFHDNENGILGQGGASNTLLIEHSIFERNGYCPVGTGCAHNVYIGTMGTFIFRYNKSIDSKEGHTLKSRATINEVVGNYFSTKNSDGSYEIEFPNGGTAYLIGNVIEQGVNSGNATILSYGAEGATNANPALHVVNNTFSNLKGAGTFISVNGSPAFTLKNNIFSGGGSIGINNPDVSNKQLTASSFVNAAGGNYRLIAGSTAIDGGVNPGVAGTYNLAPQWEYVEPAGKVARVQSGATIDAGAYEFFQVATDTTPGAFNFASQNGVSLNAVATSNVVTPVGYNGTTTISVSAGGSYSVNGGAFVSTAGTLSPGQSVAVRQTAAGTFSTSRTLTLIIGGVSGTFTVTTQAQDTTPDVFGFSAQTGAALNGAVTSNSVIPTGYNAAAPISVSPGASYSINGGAFVAAAGTISPGQSVAVRVTAAGTFSTTATATLTIGGIAAPFVVTTQSRMAKAKSLVQFALAPPPAAQLPPPQTYGLEWSGDGAVRRMLYWSNPFPIYDATYVFKVYPRKKTTPPSPNGYYTTFFWGNNGDFAWQGGTGNTYYGAHPYPIPAPFGPGQWELVVGGQDWVTGSEVVWDRWYTQAFRAWRESPSVTHHEFYYDLPDLTKVIRVTITFPNWATQNPPNPAIVMGQAPNLNGESWGGFPGWEEFKGIIRGIQMYSGLLSINDILSEIASPMSTTAGNNLIWYLNLNPRPTDVSDKKGIGTPNNPAWAGTTAFEWVQ